VASGRKGPKAGQVGRSRAGAAGSLMGRRGLVAAGAVALVLIAGFALSGLGGPRLPGSLEQGNGGSWRNIDADTLASMLQAKDFTLLNVKVPYIGEIEGTDLYIPYTDLAPRAAELPRDKAARIVVYCRAGNESRVAAQTLLDLGYGNVWNLDKGIESWVASGRAIVQKNRG